MTLLALAGREEVVQDVEPVPVGQAEVEEDDVGLEGAAELQAGGRRAGPADVRSRRARPRRP